MLLEDFLLFVPACFAFNLAPGPNNLLSVSNATRYGFWVATSAGMGRILAFIMMIVISAAGLAAALKTSLLLFYAIKLIGVVYIFTLLFSCGALRQWWIKGRVVQWLKGTF